MDPISYGVAAKQKQRIEKVIAEPDSTSGVITVPQVIATGETITVPAGRTAVLPNVQVDGTLVVDGEVFIPSGAGLSTVVQKSGDTMTGNLNFASGTKITGDFSNVDRTQRVSVQSSTANSATILQTIPNGSGIASYNVCFGSSDVSNSTSLAIGASMTSAVITADKVGPASYPPMVFSTGGGERMRIDTAGNVLVTGSGGLGYGTGSGGTVTQLTNKSTAVTLNKPTGQITMNNAALAAGAKVTFIVNNIFATPNDLIIVNFTDTTPDETMYTLDVVTLAGGFGIVVRNTHTSPLSEALVLNFAIIKGANA